MFLNFQVLLMLSFYLSPLKAFETSKIVRKKQMLLDHWGEIPAQMGLPFHNKITKWKGPRKRFEQSCLPCTTVP